MMIDQAFTFRRTFFKKAGTLVPLPASASTKICRFHRFRFHIPAAEPLQTSLMRVNTLALY